MTSPWSRDYSISGCGSRRRRGGNAAHILQCCRCTLAMLRAGADVIGVALPATTTFSDDFNIRYDFMVHFEN